MIGFLLGGEFTGDAIHRQGRANFGLAVIQGLVTAVLVSVGLWVAGVEGELALMLGGVAVATAPAATLAVVQEQRARGPFARRLISVVAVDDVVALTLFGFLATVATWSVASERTGLVRDSIWEIVGAVLIGLVLGLPAAALTGRLRPGTPTREEAYAAMLLCAGLAVALDVSYLLAAVVMGATVANRAKHHAVTFREVERVEWPALVIFFVLAGASLELSQLAEIGWLGAGYVGLRTLGKVAGCELGGRVARMPRNESRWLGLAMLPQAGVAIGLALLASDRFPEVGEQLLAVVIAATVLFELVGPILTKLALERVGEARPA